MHSKTSKPRAKPPSLWKAEPACSESKLTQIARELALELKSGHRVFLEGALGAGKSTFARAVLQALGVHQPPEGSPTFAIAHEYLSPRGEVVHIDFYRLKNESEIEDAGITAYFWERDAIILAEWASLWPDFARTVRGVVWRVSLEIEGPETRSVQIERSE